MFQNTIKKNLMLSQGGKKGQENIKKINKTSWESIIVADI
jgi:hypothetical protein